MPDPSAPTLSARRLPLTGRVLLWAGLVFWLSGCAVPQGGLPVAGVRNLHQVDARLFRSAQPEPGGFDALAQRGIKTVINLRMPGDVLPGEQPAAEAHHMTYRPMPLPAWHGPTPAQVDKILALIDSATPPVLVHCRRGADRTGMIVACYRIRHDGWTAERALAEAEEHGMAWVQVGMKSFVEDFARREHAR